MKTITRKLKFSAAWRWTALALVACGLLVSREAGGVGSWIPLTPPLGTNAGHMLLLSDATVMVQNGITSNWLRLTPGSTGGYTNGTWTNLASSMDFKREYYSSDVLPDGRVFIAGGENPIKNGPQSSNSVIYNPSNNMWTQTAQIAVIFSDSISIVLPNGNVMVAPVQHNAFSNLVCVIYNPTLDSWLSNPPVTFSNQNEVTWVKLPDESILTVDKNHQTSERFIPSQNMWIIDADLPVNLWAGVSETGAALLLPNGNAFYLGATGHTAIYTPTGTTNNGSWAPGPDIPNGRVACDAPAAMMVNGKILCAVGSTAVDGGSPAPTWFYEYDYTLGTNANAFMPTSSPTNSSVGSSYNNSANKLCFLDLPDGNVLVSDSSDASAGQLYIYQPDSPPLASGKPTITSVSWNADGSLHLTGTLFNGISQGTSFGDDEQEDSNYPLVRFTDAGGRVYYGRSYNWSSTGVMTGTKIVTTECKVPANVYNRPGSYSLQVVANGIASDPLAFYGPVWVDFNYTVGAEDGSYAFPFDTLVKGINAVVSGGTIALNASIQPSHTSATLMIAKPMSIISVNGPSTIGK
jgi:hypothetical protein